jgi:uncharacterized protein (TIGR03118 family)
MKMFFARSPLLNRTTFVLVSFALIMAVPLFAQHYNRTDLTADMTSTSPGGIVSPPDPNLVNAWGLARSSTSFWWIADNGTGRSTLYTGAGVAQPIVVKIPTPDGTGTAAPTGVVYNYSSSFEVAPGFPALFIFVTEDGTVSAWNPRVDAKNAVLKKDRSKTGAIYKGAALVQTSRGLFLDATNFETGKVDMFDSNFQFVGSRQFELDNDDGNVKNFVPFNIQNVGGNLVVTFARRQPGAQDEDHGAGIGLAGIFDANGHLLTQLQHGSWFNAPWGVALAPADFGPFSHRLLIGNFGDGAINAFNIVTGKHEGTMLAPDGSTLKVDGLWALGFGGNAPNNGSSTELFFTAGPNDEKNGLFGKLTSIGGAEQRGSSE